MAYKVTLNVEVTINDLRFVDIGKDGKTFLVCDTKKDNVTTTASVVSSDLPATAQVVWSNSRNSFTIRPVTQAAPVAPKAPATPTMLPPPVPATPTALVAFKKALDEAGYTPEIGEWILAQLRAGHTGAAINTALINAGYAKKLHASVYTQAKTLI